MIFRPELVNLILAGEKTMTRRRVKGPCRYRGGKSYAVQPGRERAAVCRISVVMIRQERLGDISAKDAKREGFKNQRGFIDYWASLYGSFDADVMVWVIGFVLGDYEDRPRLLAARCGGPNGDYVSSASQSLAGTAEEVPAASQMAYSVTAGENRGIVRAEQKRASRVVIASLRANGASNRDLRQAHSLAGQSVPIVYDRASAA